MYYHVGWLYLDLSPSVDTQNRPVVDT